MTLQDIAENTLADPWFVVWTESRAEKKVQSRLVALGVSAWLPVVTERHRWSDRWRNVDCPLFPGYLFARASLADWSRILRTPGVLTVITEGGRPALISDSFLRLLRDAIARDGADPESIDENIDFEPGEEVIVQEGALRGVRGVVREKRGRRQIVLWVDQIGRGVAFTIDSALVTAVERR